MKVKETDKPTEKFDELDEDHSWEYYTPELPVDKEKYKSTAHTSYFEA